MGVKRRVPIAVAAADGVEREQHRPRMIPVSVRKHDTFDLAEINAKP